MKKQKTDYQCADCFCNEGDNGKGCYCSKRRKFIKITDKECRDFKLNPDLEGYVEFEPGKFIWDEMANNP